MRSKHFSIIAALLLASSALTVDAIAAQRGGGAPAAPHFSAPAAHFSAPAAHFSAPAAHFSAPATHLAAPAVRFAAPARIAAPHIAGPRFNAPRFAAHRTAPAFTRGNAAPSLASRRLHAPGLTQHALTPSTTPHAGAIGNAANRPNERTTTGTVGAAPSTTNRNAAFASRQGTGSNRILRNSVLTSLAARDPAARSLASSTFRGRFAQSGFARDGDRDHHHHHFGFVLGFAGPLFWPYAYDDFVDYTFWPDAYDTFWPYAYDDVFEGLYGAYAPEYGATYAYAGAPASSAAYQNGSATAGAAATQVCSGETQGLTDFPIDQIARQVTPNQQQQGLLDDLKAATQKAVGILQAACPNDLPATPTGRLAAMHIRVAAMLQAVQTVQPALDKFYASLSDEQKERFNALDENAFGTAPQQDVAQLCGSKRSSPVNLPVARIEQSLRLSSAQNADLKALDDASAKSAQILDANCPTGQTLTPPGRVAAMAQRLNGMLQAIEAVRPALTKFYGSLSDEQKARFDRLGRQPA